ncbi:MAG: TRAP transporter permease [Spirochaetes bacterium]|nr:MAG: TRAP transporter permease [Spirochaetota bacterium]
MFGKRRKKSKELEIQLQTGGNRRELGEPMSTFIKIVAVLFALMGLASNSFWLIMSMQQVGLFTAFLLFLIFLLYPATPKSPKTYIPVYDWILAVLGACGGLYTFFFANEFAMRALQPLLRDYIAGVITLLLVLEAARRAAGKWIAIICFFFVVYALYGRYFPGVFKHRGFSFERVLIRLYLVDEGIYGITGRVASTYIFLFIMFGAFLKASGVADFFNQFALALAGRGTGGPAKVAVVTSAITGTISGSGVANVATTGSFTIPLMKRVGYKARFAGAVEAAASSGGLLMPPIMGTAAFIMAEFLGVSYTKIVIAGFLPAVFYYIAVFTMVHLEAKRLGLGGMDKSELPRIRDVLLTRGHLIIPLFILLYMLLSGRSPIFAAFMALISTVVLSWIRKDTRMGIRKIIEALHIGGITILGVGIACVSVGMVVGVVAMTGIGQVIAYNILKLSFNMLILALLFTMVAAIFLSMGLPASAAYIIVATVSAPALMRMGVAPLVAHFFVFYFGSLSNLTPPVALASYTAAGISGEEPARVAWSGLRLTFTGFIIPFIFVYNPMLLLQNVEIIRLIIGIITTVLAIAAFCYAERGFVRVKLLAYERLIFFIAFILLIIPEMITNGIGGVLLVLGYIIHFIRAPKLKTA